MLVKSLRQKNNWSQEQLAQLSGLNIRTIQRVEKGDSVGIETFKSLAAVFEVEVSELKNANSTEKQITKPDKESLVEIEKRKEIAKSEVQAKKEFYMLSLCLVGVFIFFFLPNYNQGENLGALISCAVSFALIIGVHAYTVFQPFGEKWEKRKIQEVLDSYKK